MKSELLKLKQIKQFIIDISNLLIDSNSDYETNTYISCIKNYGG